MGLGVQNNYEGINIYSNNFYFYRCVQIIKCLINFTLYINTNVEIFKQANLE